MKGKISMMIGLLLANVVLISTGLTMEPPIAVQLLPFDFPRLDELYMTIAFPRTVSVEKAKACDIDNFIGATVVGDINTLTGPPYNWSISMNPGYHMCYIGVNCRGVTPSSSGAYYNYHNRVPGFALYPLELSQFRMALEIMVSGFKTAWLAALYGYITVRIDTVVPPANTYWYNPCISQYPDDWAIAENMLLGAGFTWNYGPDGLPHTTDDIWHCPNGMVLWDGTRAAQPKSDRYAGTISATILTPVYGIWVMWPGVGPTLTIVENHVDKWNLFFTGVEAHPGPGGADQLLFIDDPQLVAAIVSWVPFYNRDHDIYMLCWGLGRNLDYLYDFFSPEVDVEGGDNSPGLDHPGTNKLLRTIKFWKLNDYEIIESNVGSPCNSEKIVLAGSMYGPYIGFDAVVASVEAMAERVDLALGVYEEKLTEGTHYAVSWAQNPLTFKWEVSITMLTNLTLGLGDALEVSFPEGTYNRLIVDVDEMKNIVYLAQWKLYYLAPYLPIYSRNYINLYKPGVTDWVNSVGFGSEPIDATMPWTFNSLHWTSVPVGGSMKYHDSGAVSTLNPILISWTYEVVVLGRICEALYVINPYTHEDKPWIAQKWEIIPYINESMGVYDGMIIRLWLRDDVYWQDGDHVTAEDVAWNFDFIESLTPPKYAAIWQNLVKVEIIHGYLLELYMDATGLWKLYNLLDSALKFPQAAWQAYKGDYNESTTTDYDAAVAYKPWTVLRNTKPGNAGPADLTMLYGTGPYYFVYWDTTVGQGIIKMKKNTKYWVRTAAVPTGQMPQIYVEGLCYKVMGVEKIPKVIHTYLDVTVHNINSKEPCTFSWELLMDGTTAIGNGSVSNLEPLNVTHMQVRFVSPRSIPACVHNFTFTVTTAAGSNAYTIQVAVTFADLNCDCKVDIKDLVILIKAFGTAPSVLRWNMNADINGDDKVDIKDLVILIGQFGRFCGS